MEFQAVLDAVRSLPTEEQARLVDMIQDELESSASDTDLSPVQIEELDRRLADIKKNPGAGTPWEQVRVEARARQVPASDHMQRRLHR
jgi:putative addiction module component (TIGR02574 family)